MWRLTLVSQMAGSAGTSDITASTSGPVEPVIASIGERGSNEISNKTEQEFRKEWESLSDKIESSREESTDLDERLSKDNRERALELAKEYPEHIEVEYGSFGRRNDLTEHLQGHFETLFNSDRIIEEFRPPLPGKSIEALIKFSEIVYINDAVYRFGEGMEMEPQLSDLSTLNFMTFPEGLAEWMERGEMILLAVKKNNPLELNGDIVEEINTLYEDRDEFIQSGMDIDMFHPITPERLSETKLEVSDIRSQMRRDEVNIEKLHRHCYNSLVEETVWGTEG